MGIGRNNPCACGSGKKYKHCCEANAGPHPATSELGQLAFLYSSGRFPEAEQLARMLLKRHSASGELWKALGYSLGKQGKDAVSALRKAASLLPADADVQAELGNVLNAQGQHGEALKCYQNAISVAPGNAMTHNNLATVLQELGQIEQAVAHYRFALSIKPDFVDAHYNLGIALKNAGRLDEAVASYRSALLLAPNDADAHCNLGVALMNAGRLDEAIACCQLALTIEPDQLEANRAYLFARLYNDAFNHAQLFDAISSFARLRTRGLSGQHCQFQGRSLDSKRKLRIGYISSDFHNHPVGRNMLPIIERHDRERFEVYLYADIKKHDGMTGQFRKTASTWRPITGMADQAVAKMIAQDKIDLLVMLAGHFDENRPMVAACRAAPVQVSLHDPITSGQDDMDYLLTDHGLSPRNTGEKFTERLFHLPSFYLHSPMDNAPEVGALPARDKGYVTFCSFNNPVKINDRVIATWAGVLHAVEHSRLLLKYKSIFSHSSVQRRFIELFQAHGIQPERLRFVEMDEPGDQHLARYVEADVALDTFPFTGSTTTFEALWMGVPVVTLLGERMVARWSGAMLKKLHLENLIANDESEFVAIARELAGNLDQLAMLRAGLRERVRQSSLCDESGRTHQIERAYRWMWTKYCAQKVK